MFIKKNNILFPFKNGEEKAQLEKYVEEGRQARQTETIDGLRDVKF